MIACSEPYRSTVAQNPVPVVKAALLLSDSAPPVGGTLVVSVQALAAKGTVGSYTAKITYDATALRFDGELAISDQALRASNPSPGLIRFAGAAASGFIDGHLASYRFVVLRANSARTLSLAVDEMHMITRLDAKTGLIVAPNSTTSR
jgi:Cohesin domain